MNSGLGSISGNISYDDAKEIELVDKIAEKTRMGKIVWERGPSSPVAATAPGMQLSFVRTSPGIESVLFSLGLGGLWEIFSIRSQQGAEIMKLEQSSGGVLFGSPGPMPSRNKLLEAVDALYLVAASRG
jgi:hypothetical protein